MGGFESGPRVKYEYAIQHLNLSGIGPLGRFFAYSKCVAMFSNFARWYFVDTDCIVRGIIRDSHQCEPCRFPETQNSNSCGVQGCNASSVLKDLVPPSPLSLSLSLSLDKVTGSSNVLPIKVWVSLL